MAVVRYTPLDDFLRSVMVKPLTETKDQALSLAIDVRENEHAYLVSADIPGARKEDIQVNINGAHVSISVERKNEKSVNEHEKILRSERSFGKVSRAFEMEHEIDESQASAKYTEGVLELVLPKKIVCAATRLTIN